MYHQFWLNIDTAHAFVSITDFDCISKQMVVIDKLSWRYFTVYRMYVLLN